MSKKGNLQLNKQLSQKDDASNNKTFAEKSFAKMEDEFVVYRAEDEVQLTEKEKELSEKILSDSTEKVMENRSSKGKIFNICCFALSVIILVVTLLYQSNKFGVHDINKSLFDGIRVRYLFYIMGAFLLIMLFDSLKTHVLLYKSTKIHRPFLSYKSTAICRYYDCVTPFSFGGQPFQVFYLNSRGVKAGIASSVPLAKYMFSQVAFCIISLVMLCIGHSYYGSSSGVVITFSIISLILCFLFLFGIMFISMSKKLAPRIFMGIINFLGKIKLVKNPRVTFTKTMRTMLEYQRSIKFYIKSFWTTFIITILSVGMIVLKGCIPYFIYLLLTPGQAEATFIVIFSKFIICELATMFIPLPGGSGMAEISFTALFASLFTGGNEGFLFWAVLVYRISSYYIYLFQGVVISLYDICVGDKRNEKFKNGKLIEMQLKAKAKRNKSF